MKSCGTCKWWSEQSPRDGLNRCHIPISELKVPEWMADQARHLRRDIQRANDGTICNTWEGK